MKNSPKLPRWKLRRLRLLNKAFKTTEYKKLVKDVDSGVILKDNAAKALVELMPQIGLPGECYYIALIVLLNTGILKNEEQVISMINSPIKWVSFKDKSRGPDEYPESFSDWEKARNESIKNGYDPLAENNSVLIEIKPTTTKEELLDFIKEYFDNEIKPHLAIQGNDSYYYPDSMDIGRRITDESTYRQRTEEIVVLYKQGLTPKEIADRLNYAIEPSNIRTILSRLRKDEKL